MTTKPLTQDDVKRLARYFNQRERLILRVGVQTGLRIGDIISLRKIDVKPRFTLVEHKTNKERVVSLSKELTRDLRAYSRYNKEFVFESKDCRRKDKPITRHAVYYHFKKAVKAMQLPPGTSCHSMRKTYAVRIYNQTDSLKAVQSALNHDRLETTVLYLMSEFVQGRASL